LEKTSLISRRERIGPVGRGGAALVELVEGAEERSESAVEVRVRGRAPYIE